MKNEIDWDLVRRSKFADANIPPDWPRDVRPISIKGLQLFGINGEGRICWDGKPLQTVNKLGFFERVLATLVALGTISMAVFDILRFLGWGAA